MPRTHMITSALLFGAIALVTGACGNPGLEPVVDEFEANAPQGMLRIAPVGAYDFGELSPQAPRQRGELRLWVEGGTPVRVTSLYLDATTSSAFSLPADTPVPVELQPGDEALIGIYFEPYAAGQYFGDVVVEMVEDGEARELTLALEGEGCIDNDANGGCD